MIHSNMQTFGYKVGCASKMRLGKWIRVSASMVVLCYGTGIWKHRRDSSSPTLYFFFVVIVHYFSIWLLRKIASCLLIKRLHFCQVNCKEFNGLCITILVNNNIEKACQKAHTITNYLPNHKKTSILRSEWMRAKKPRYVTWCILPLN